MESLTTPVGTTARTAGATRTGAPAGRPDRRPAASTRWAAFAFIAPLIVYLAVFYAYPLYRNIDLSLHDYTPRAFVQGNAAWVGLKNYTEILASSTFAKAAVNTALESLALRVLDDHVRHCVAGAFASGDADEAEQKTVELMKAVQRFAKTR